MTDITLQTEELTKRFGARTAVDRLSMRVERGDIYGFLGPNGAGKSTTLRMLLGLVRPTSGAIKFQARASGWDYIRARAAIGAIVETPAFYENFSGRRNLQLLASLSGETPGCDSGCVLIEGQRAETLDPTARRELGLTFVPEERLGRGAVPALSLADNALLTGARKGMVNHGLIQHGATKAFARAVIDAFKVKCGSELSIASSLSGGNLQKFIVGREVRLAPRVMVVAQPTWGVDVGAAQLIHQALIDLRDAGVAILVISEELDELFTLCDRIAVMSEGTLSAASPTSTLTVDAIGVMMAGAAHG